MCTVLLLAAGEARAWPTNLVECLVRDARRVIPRSLSRLIADNEKAILEQSQHFPMDLGQLLVADLASGSLKPPTLLALDGFAARPLPLLKEMRVTEGVVAVGVTLRIPADLSDPALASGSEGFPPGLTREYYAFVNDNLSRLPVVLESSDALKLKRADLPSYWSGLFEQSRADAPLLRAELYRGGRLVDHRSLDWHSPVFAVAQVAYSRAVTGIAATWLAVWREARGDMTLMRTPVEIAPSDRPPEATP